MVAGQRLQNLRHFELFILKSKHGRLENVEQLDRVVVHDLPERPNILFLFELNGRFVSTISLQLTSKVLGANLKPKDNKLSSKFRLRIVKKIFKL